MFWLGHICELELLSLSGHCCV